MPCMISKSTSLVLGGALLALSPQAILSPGNGSWQPPVIVASQ
jgi:hypothetical protein